MKYLGTYEKNQDIATKEKIEAKLSYDATSDTVMQGGADVTEKVAKSLDMYIAPSNIGAVAYTNQELTDEQKQQARTNIGVGDATKDAKGIVQIGDNLNIADGVLSRDKDVYEFAYVDAGYTDLTELNSAYDAGKIITCTVRGRTYYLAYRLQMGANKYDYTFFMSSGGAIGQLELHLNGLTKKWVWTASVKNFDVATTINRTTYVNQADTNYTTLMARGEKLLDATTFDAVTDWSTQLVNGAIAWRYS